MIINLIVAGVIKIKLIIIKFIVKNIFFSSIIF